MEIKKTIYRDNPDAPKRSAVDDLFASGEPVEDEAQAAWATGEAVLPDLKPGKFKFKAGPAWDGKTVPKITTGADEKPLDFTEEDEAADAAAKAQRAPSGGEAVFLGTAQGLTLDHADELAGAVRSIAPDEKDDGFKSWIMRFPERFGNERDAIRADDQAARAEHPWKYAGGHLGSTLATLAVPGAALAKGAAAAGKGTQAAITAATMGAGAQRAATAGKAVQAGLMAAGAGGMGAVVGEGASNAPLMSKDTALAAGIGGGLGAAFGAGGVLKPVATGTVGTAMSAGTALFGDKLGMDDAARAEAALATPLAAAGTWAAAHARRADAARLKANDSLDRVQGEMKPMINADAEAEHRALERLSSLEKDRDAMLASRDQIRADREAKLAARQAAAQAKLKEAKSKHMAGKADALDAYDAEVNSTKAAMSEAEKRRQDAEIAQVEDFAGGHNRINVEEPNARAKADYEAGEKVIKSKFSDLDKALEARGKELHNQTAHVEDHFAKSVVHEEAAKAALAAAAAATKNGTDPRAAAFSALGHMSKEFYAGVRTQLGLGEPLTPNMEKTLKILHPDFEARLDTLAKEFHGGKAALMDKLVAEMEAQASIASPPRESNFAKVDAFGKPVQKNEVTSASFNSNAAAHKEQPVDYRNLVPNDERVKLRESLGLTADNDTPSAKVDRRLAAAAKHGLGFQHTTVPPDHVPPGMYADYPEGFVRHRSAEPIDRPKFGYAASPEAFDPDADFLIPRFDKRAHDAWVADIKKPPKPSPTHDLEGNTASLGPKDPNKTGVIPPPAKSAITAAEPTPLTTPLKDYDQAANPKGKKILDDVEAAWADFGRAKNKLKGLEGEAGQEAFVNSKMAKLDKLLKSRQGKAEVADKRLADFQASPKDSFGSPGKQRSFEKKNEAVGRAKSTATAASESLKTRKAAAEPDAIRAEGAKRAKIANEKTPIKLSLDGAKDFVSRVTGKPVSSALKDDYVRADYFDRVSKRFDRLGGRFSKEYGPLISGIVGVEQAEKIINGLAESDPEAGKVLLEELERSSPSTR